MTIESVNPVAYNSMSSLLLQAMVSEAEEHGVDFTQYFGIKYAGTPQAGNVDVQVLVNGKPVPFMDELGAALRRLTDDFENVVRERALRLIGLSKVAEKVRRLNESMEEKLDDIGRSVDDALKEVQNG